MGHDQNVAAVCVHMAPHLCPTSPWPLVFLIVLLKLLTSFVNALTQLDAHGVWMFKLFSAY